VDKILVCGSRPDPRLIEADYYYYINGAISIDSNHDRRSVNQIVAKNAFLKASSSNDSLDRAWIENVISDKASTILFVGKNDIDQVVSRYKKLGGNIDGKNIVDILPEERNRIVEVVCGVSMPVGYKVAIELAAKFHIRPLIKSLKYLIKGPTDWEAGDCAGILRPSNGVFGLVNAIYKHGKDSEYYLSGVGLDFYNYSYSFSGEVVRKRKNIRPHLLADISILHKMKEYNVYVDDPFVADLCGLKLAK